MAAKEEYAEKVQELMSNPENIRNIAICSHIHHGKCISKDSRIALADGSFIRAEDIFDKYSKYGKKIISNKNETVIDISKTGLKALSLNKKTLKIEEKQIQFIWKLKADKELINIELDNGLKISTTPEHKFFIFDGKFKEIEAEKLQTGMFVVCGRNLNYENCICSK